MRIVKVAFWVIFVLMLIAAAGIYIFIKTFDISRYQERITSEISRQLGREVVLDKIGLEADLARGITLVISDFQIADAPDFSSEYFMIKVNETEPLLPVYLWLHLRSRGTGDEAC